MSAGRLSSSVWAYFDLHQASTVRLCCYVVVHRVAPWILQGDAIGCRRKGLDVNSPLVTSFRNISHSDAIEQHVVQRFEELKKYHPRIVGCDAVIGAPCKRQVSGREFEVHLTVKIPGPDVHIHESIGRSTAEEDVNLAVHRAFDAARRVLKKQKQKMDGIKVKQHPPVLHGRVERLFLGEGYGFIKADDGNEVYFERENLTKGDWDGLVLNAKVRFREEAGEKGPYAINVAVQS